MKYLFYGLLLIMTSSFRDTEVQISNNQQELYLYTYYTIYKFHAVPYKSLKFSRTKVFFIDNQDKKIAVEYIILRNGKYYVYLEGDPQIPND